MSSPVQASKSESDQKPVEGVVIDARGVHYRELNERVADLVRRHQAEAAGLRQAQPRVPAKGGRSVSKGGADAELHVRLTGVCGQRYIACGLRSTVHIDIQGVPGNDLAAFAEGPTVTVFGNCQDATANTMSSGLIVVHGSAGDVLGYAMRGGQVFVRDNVGYRVGIHMKSYQDMVPVIVVGGRSGDFLGEYMAGGVILVLGRPPQAGRAQARGFSPLALGGTCREGSSDPSGRPLSPSGTRSPVGEQVGTGMHGGAIYVRGPVDKAQLGQEVDRRAMEASDQALVSKLMKRYQDYFHTDDIAPDPFDKFRASWSEFTKLVPASHRPYGRLYAY
jgi:glutamate synthase domain-containing protein 3